jgi:hypothetical protein
MTDRLRDLKRGNAGSGGGQIGGGTQGGDITMSQIHQPAAGQGLIIPSAQRQSCLFSPDAFMKTFFEDVEMVKSHLTQISQATDNLREIHSEVFFLFPLHSPWLTFLLFLPFLFEIPLLFPLSLSLSILLQRHQKKKTV